MKGMSIVRQSRPFYDINEKLHHKRENLTMQLKTKAYWSVIPIIVALCISSCSPSSGLPEKEASNTATPSQSILKTSMGDFVIASSRLVDEIHDQKSPSGEKFLLVILTHPNLKNLAPAEFSLETFQKTIQDSSGQIYVSGKDDAQFISTMAGWVQEEFTMGFTVPVAESYTLHWPGNSPIELSPKAQ
jgi:hypothetical protein